MERPDHLAKFDGLAHGYAAHDYADPPRYLARRAAVVTGTGPRLDPGATILDLACADGNMARPLEQLGFRYRGVDGSEAMIAEARRTLGESVPLEVSLLQTYVPPEPVEMTLLLRAIKYVDDRPAFFERLAGFTRTKLVLDFPPEEEDTTQMLTDLRAAGWTDVVQRPFFLPQHVPFPAPLRLATRALERTGPLARGVMRFTGIWVWSAVPPRS
jgi:hypothetical protein